MEFNKFYEELSTLNEDARVTSFKFSNIRSLLEKHPEHWEDVKRIIQSLGYSNTWEYQFQLMYNAYVTERYTKDILIPEHREDINKALEKYNKKLAAKYEFNNVPNNHEVLSASMTGGNDIWDLMAATPAEDTINSIEVKATGESDTSKGYHNAELVIIYTLSKNNIIDTIIKYRPTDGCADKDYIVLDTFITASALGRYCIIVDPVASAKIRPFNDTGKMSLFDDLKK